jgi:hypothetical protein
MHHAYQKMRHDVDRLLELAQLPTVILNGPNVLLTVVFYKVNLFRKCD